MTFIPPLAKKLSKFTSVEEFNYHYDLHMMAISDLLTDSMKKVVETLSRFSVCSHASTIGVAWLKRNTLASYSEVSISTVERTLTVLKKVGMIEIVHTKRKNGIQGNSYYTFTLVTEDMLEEEIVEVESVDDQVDPIAISDTEETSEVAEIDPLTPDSKEVEAPKKEDKHLSSLSPLNPTEEDKYNKARARNNFNINTVKEKDLKNNKPNSKKQEQISENPQKNEVRSHITPQMHRLLNNQRDSYSITIDFNKLLAVYDSVFADLTSLNEQVLELIIVGSLKNLANRLQSPDPIFCFENYFTTVVRNQVIPAQIQFAQNQANAHKLAQRQQRQQELKNSYVPALGAFLQQAT